MRMGSAGSLSWQDRRRGTPLHPPRRPTPCRSSRAEEGRARGTVPLGQGAAPREHAAYALPRPPARTCTWRSAGYAAPAHMLHHVSASLCDCYPQVKDRMIDMSAFRHVFYIELLKLVVKGAYDPA